MTPALMMWEPRVWVKLTLIGIDVSAPVIGHRPSNAISGTAWLLFCSVPSETRGIRPSGLLRGAICRSPASTPPGLAEPEAGQAFGGAQSPSAAFRSYPFWILARARSFSGGPLSVL